MGIAFAFAMMAKKIDAMKKSGGVGSVTPGVKLTFDGNTDGKFTFNSTILGEHKTLAKITDKVYDLTKVTALTVMGETSPASDFTTVTHNEIGDDDWTAMYSFDAEAIATLGISGLEVGTYFVTNEVEGMTLYASTVEFPETIHTIDEKFLPSMVETINLDDYGVDLVAFLLSGGGKTSFTAPGLGEAMCVESEIEIVSEAYGIKCRPVTVGRSNGIPCYFGFRLCLATGTGVILADFTITPGINGTTFLDTVRVWIGNISQITH